MLGPEVHQRGSNITSERLRIDFSSPGKMTDEQKQRVEDIVNGLIYEDLPVTRTVMPREDAEKLGAEMEFGVKYPDMVSVYSVGRRMPPKKARTSRTRSRSSSAAGRTFPIRARYTKAARVSGYRRRKRSLPASAALRR